MISLDATIFLTQMANFLLLIFILNILLYKPILSIIEKRKKQLELSDEEIKSLNMTVEQKAAEYDEKLRMAKQNVLDEKNVILKDAADQAKEIIEARRNKIPAMMAEFQERIAQEVNGARQILKSQSQQISTEIAEKVLGRSL